MQEAKALVAKTTQLPPAACIFLHTKGVAQHEALKKTRGNNPAFRFTFNKLFVSPSVIR
jgi:hypothetical protein